MDPAALRIATTVNGAIRQDSATSDLLFPVAYIIAYLSRHLTLLPGDLIMTGTPSGVGPIKPGDTVEVEIPPIGKLSNPLILAE